MTYKDESVYEWKIIFKIQINLKKTAKKYQAFFS